MIFYNVVLTIPKLIGSGKTQPTLAVRLVTRVRNKSITAQCVEFQLNETLHNLVGTDQSAEGRAAVLHMAGDRFPKTTGSIESVYRVRWWQWCPWWGGVVELPPSTPWARIATAVTTRHQAMSNAPTPGACGTVEHSWQSTPTSYIPTSTMDKLRVRLRRRIIKEHSSLARKTYYLNLAYLSCYYEWNGGGVRF